MTGVQTCALPISFFVVLTGSDPEAADFWNSNLPFLRSIAPGRVVMVRNLRDGMDFSLASPEGCPVIDVLQAEPPLSLDFFNGQRRRTLRSIINSDDASYRSRLDAEYMHEHLTKQLQQHSSLIL